MGNGKYRDVAAGIKGSILPVLIHSTKTKDQVTDKQSAADKRISLYDADPDEVETVKDRFLSGMDRFSNLDMKVCGSQNGSMTKELFLEV